MSRIDKFLAGCDARLDLLTTRFSQKLDNRFFFVSLSFFLVLMLLTVGKEIYHKPRFIAGVISQDVQNLAAILGEINERCLIKAISSSRIKLNFLTATHCAGPNMGGLVLDRPENWEGPYVSATPRIQGKEYELVQAAEGFFVLPGDGVRLPNNLRMGKHVKVSPRSNVTAMLTHGGKLFSHERALGAHVGNHQVFMTNEEPIKQVDENVDNQRYQHAIDMLKEIADALPFASATPVSKDVKF